MYRRMKHPPPWWPANEPWPPRDRWRRYGRSRRMRHAGCAFGFVFILSATGLIALISSPARPASAAVIAGSIVIATAILLVAGVRLIGLPIISIVSAADRVADGDYATRLDEHGPPAIRSVARAFNSMTERLRVNEELRRNLMADIAHELRTPLAVMQARLEALADGVYPRDEQQMQQLLDETRVLARLVEDLRTLANAESGALTLRKESSDLAVLINDAIRSVEAAPISIRANVDDLPLVEIDPLRIREVFVNLLTNAIRHARSAVTVSAREVDREIRIEVTDDGSGIAADELPKIFDRFYKGATSRGSGLGLTIARNLVHAHGGKIEAASQPGSGTTIRFTLPSNLHN